MTLQIALAEKIAASPECYAILAGITFWLISVTVLLLWNHGAHRR